MTDERLKEIKDDSDYHLEVIPGTHTEGCWGCRQLRRQADMVPLARLGAALLKQERGRNWHEHQSRAVVDLLEAFSDY